MLKNSSLQIVRQFGLSCAVFTATACSPCVSIESARQEPQGAEVNTQHAGARSQRRVSLFNTRVRIGGRFAPAEGGAKIGYPGVSVTVVFLGSELSVVGSSSRGNNRFSVSVDGQPHGVVQLAERSGRQLAVQGLSNGRHTVVLTHLNETWQGVATLEALIVDGPLEQLPPARGRRLILIGDSITCGEAIERTASCEKKPNWWNPSASYGVLVGDALSASVHLVCYGGRGLVRDWQGLRDVQNAPTFFELAVPEGTGSRWDHTRYQPEVIVVALGTNDFNLGLGSFPERAEYVEAAVSMTRRLRSVHPQARIIWTEGAMVSDLAEPKRAQKAVLRDYLNEAVRLSDDARVSFFGATHQPGDACDPHPTKAQHRAMATELAAEIRRLEGWQ